MLMKIKRLLSFVLALMLLVTFTACGKGKEQDTVSSVASSEPEEIDPNWPVVLGDIRVAEKPDRVVSLSPALTEILCELGGAERLAGISDYCDYPKQVQEIDTCGSAAIPDMEAIKQSRATVLFASAPLSQKDTVELQQMGVEVVILPRVDSLDGLEEVYVAAATVLDGMVDGEANGKAVFSALRARYDALTQAAAGIEERISGIYLRAVPLAMATGDTFEGEWLESIGVDNDAKEYTGWEYPADKAVDLYPDVVFYDSSIDPAYFKGTQVYNTTDAYKNNRMYPVEAIVFERQSGRMIDALERMFREAYPELADSVGAPAEDASAESASEPEESEAPQSTDDEMLDIGDATQVHP